MFLVPVLPSKAEVESHNVSRLPSEAGALRVSCGRGFSLRHRKVHTKTKEAGNRCLTVSVDCGVLGALPVLIVLDRQSEGHLESPGAVEGRDAPVSCGGL